MESFFNNYDERLLILKRINNAKKAAGFIAKFFGSGVIRKEYLHPGLKVKDVRLLYGDACKYLKWRINKRKLDDVCKVEKMTREKLVDKFFGTGENFNRLYRVASFIPRMGYSMGQESRVFVAGCLVAVCDTREDYKGGRYRARHGYQSIYLTVKEAQRVKVVGGLITIFDKELAKGIWKVRWYESTGQKQYFDLSVISGFLFDNYHFYARNDKEAIRKGRELQKEAKDLERRKKLLDKHIKVVDSLPLSRIWVSFEDSLKGGNCAPGTYEFARNIGIDLKTVGAVRADVIVSHAKELNIETRYVNSAIYEARRKYLQILFSH